MWGDLPSDQRRRPGRRPLKKCASPVRNRASIAVEDQSMPATARVPRAAGCTGDLGSGAGGACAHNECRPVPKHGARRHLTLASLHRCSCARASARQVAEGADTEIPIALAAVSGCPWLRSQGLARAFMRFFTPVADRCSAARCFSTLRRLRYGSSGTYTGRTASSRKNFSRWPASLSLSQSSSRAMSAFRVGSHENTWMLFRISQRLDKRSARALGRRRAL